MALINIFFCPQLDSGKDAGAGSLRVLLAFEHGVLREFSPNCSGYTLGIVADVVQRTLAL